MASPTTQLNDARLLEERPDGGALVRNTAEEHIDIALAVRLDNLCQDLCRRCVERCNAVHVEDDVLVMLFPPHPRERRVCRGRPVVFQTLQPVLEIASVEKGKRFWDLDDQAAFDEFQAIRIHLCVGELVRSAWHAAEDLDARACGVADETKDRETNANTNAALEIPKDGHDEDETHQDELRPATDTEEELDVVRCFFDEGIGHDGDHGTEHSFWKVIKGRQEKEGCQEGDEGEEDGAHGRQPTGRRIHLGTTVAAKGRESHEQATSDVGGPERDELAVCREGHGDAVLAFAAAE